MDYGPTSTLSISRRGHARHRARHPDARRQRQAADGRARRPSRAGRDLARRRRRRQRALRRAARRGLGFSGGGDLAMVEEMAHDFDGRAPASGRRRATSSTTSSTATSRSSARCMGRRSAPGWWPACWPTSRSRAEERQDRRRPHPAGRRGGRPCGDRLAAAVRHGQGQVPPAAVRAGERRGGRAHRPGLAGGRRGPAAAEGLRGGRPAGAPARQTRDPLDQVRAQQLAAAGRARPSTPRWRWSSWASPGPTCAKAWRRCASAGRRSSSERTPVQAALRPCSVCSSTTRVCPSTMPFHSSLSQ